MFKPQINKLCHVHFTQFIYVPHYEYEVRDARFSSIICRCFYLQPERAWTSSLMLLDATVFFVLFFLPLGSKTASEWWGWFRAIKSESKNYKDQKLNSWRCSKVSVLHASSDVVVGLLMNTVIGRTSALVLSFRLDSTLNHQNLLFLSFLFAFIVWRVARPLLAITAAAVCQRVCSCISWMFYKNLKFQFSGLWVCFHVLRLTAHAQ